ncbi:MAG: PfkB family carbohydrate kinase [Pseudomonadota bacterium]|nr:PfkB family carbohydrate kinase [Pseudomonadota bacterium]
MPLLTFSQAARLAGVDESVIRRHVERGELAATREPDGGQRIDALELARLYPGPAVTEGQDQPLQMQRFTPLPVPLGGTGAAPTAQGICVFAPTPLFTVFVENEQGREPEIHFHAGGQGVWVARMATGLGVPTTLCAPFGGEAGRIVRMLIEAEAITVQAVDCRGPTGAYVHDRRDGRRWSSADMPSGTLDRHELDDLYDAALVSALQAGVAVLTGPAHPILPPDTYRRLALDLGRHGVGVVADLSAGPLAAALAAGVQFLKVSEQELTHGGYAAGNSVGQLAQALRRLRQTVPNILVSRIEAPALALIDRQFFMVEAPRFEPRDEHGGGDSMAAALAVGLATGMPVEAMLRLAAAAGALNLTRHGLGTGQRRHIESLAGRVVLRPVEP